MSSGYVTTTANSWNTADPVWRIWTDGTVTGNTTTDVWPMWCDSTNFTTTCDVTTGAWNYWVAVNEQAHLTKEQQAERQAQAERARLEAAERAKVQAEQQRLSEERAEALLKSVLSPEQREAYEREAAFFVQSQSGKRFKVEKKWSGNLTEYSDDGRPINRYCVHPQWKIPDQDNMALQKIMLECDEASLLQTANRTRL